LAKVVDYVENKSSIFYPAIYNNDISSKYYEQFNIDAKNILIFFSIVSLIVSYFAVKYYFWAYIVLDSLFDNISGILSLISLRSIYNLELVDRFLQNEKVT
jgi:hypothetical protein